MNPNTSLLEDSMGSVNPSKKVTKKAVRPKKSKSNRPNLTTVANKAGVSRMTASYALRDNEGDGRVSQSTIDHVKKVARELNYFPNRMARSLRQQRTNVIGVVLGNLRLDWSARIIEGLDEVLIEAGYQSMLLLHHWSVERNIREIETLLMYRVDGIISQPVTGMAKHYKELIPDTVPHIIVSDKLISDDNIDCVTWDDYEAASQMVTHLLDVGRERILFIGQNTGTSSSINRLNAYSAALSSRKLSVDPSRVVMYEPGLGSMDSLMLNQFGPGSDRAKRPDAIFAINDSHALAALKWLRANGYSVPLDVAIAGLGNLPQSDGDAAGLTTVEEPCEQMGKIAGMELIERINGGSGKRSVSVPAGKKSLRRSTMPATEK